MLISDSHMISGAPLAQDPSPRQGEPRLQLALHCLQLPGRSLCAATGLETLARCTLCLHGEHRHPADGEGPKVLGKQAAGYRERSWYCSIAGLHGFHEQCWLHCVVLYPQPRDATGIKFLPHGTGSFPDTPGSFSLLVGNFPMSWFLIGKCRYTEIKALCGNIPV